MNKDSFPSFLVIFHYIHKKSYDKILPSFKCINSKEIHEQFSGPFYIHDESLYYLSRLHHHLHLATRAADLDHIQHMPLTGLTTSMSPKHTHVYLLIGSFIHVYRLYSILNAYPSLVNLLRYQLTNG
ncbi:hypothetical protein ACJX0J_010553 [Zea mays]